MSEERGLYGKFQVARTDGRDKPGGDKQDARYFVLDYVHDPLALPALRAYADAAREAGYVALADDLERAIGERDRRTTAEEDKP